MAASLLPNAKQQFIDINGDPLVGGTVGLYIPGTMIPKVTWQDSGQTVLNTNPIVLDSRGQAIIYGVGIYRQVLKDVDGNLIWDQLTSGDNGSSAAAGNPVSITHANSPYTMRASDGLIICDTSGGNIQINMVAAVQYLYFGATIFNTGTGQVSLVANGSDTIIGTSIVAFQNQSVLMQSDIVSKWYST